MSPWNVLTRATEFQMHKRSDSGRGHPEAGKGQKPRWPLDPQERNAAHSALILDLENNLKLLTSETHKIEIVVLCHRGDNLLQQ